MAIVLKNHIIKNGLSVKIVNRDYVMVEGWQFAGGLMGLFPKISKVENIEKGKWMATAEVIDKKTGNVVSVGYAICSSQEHKKAGFDEYAILSMAQTRAIGKAYRNLIGWVIKMAGYESTPAEEIKPTPTKDPKQQDQPKTNYLNQLKQEVYKAGAKNTKEAVGLINKKTGLTLKDMNLSEKHASIVLEQWLNSNKK